MAEPIHKLDDAEAGRFVKALCRGYFDGTEPDFSDSDRGLRLLYLIALGELEREREECDADYGRSVRAAIKEERRIFELERAFYGG